MTMAPSDVGILLVDDGELDDVARVLEEEGLSFTRLRGGQIPDEVPPPRDLLIVTPRRVERVRRGSPAGAGVGRPLRIIAVHEDSPAMRRRLRRSGLHLLVRLPTATEIWRLLIARALYEGNERRENPRVAVGSPVEVAHQGPAATVATADTTLIDLSNRGCRLQTSAPFSVGDPVEFTVPSDQQEASEDSPLTLRGRVRRLVSGNDSDPRMLAVVFDSDLSQKTRTQLTRVINHWASGPQSMGSSAHAGAPRIPACQLPSIPDLMLDDETDPPVHARSEIHVELKPFEAAASDAKAQERRDRTRGRFESAVRVQDKNKSGPFVLIGRDLSAGGMRIERNGSIRLGDRFRIALHGPNSAEPLVIEAQVARDDGDDGFGLIFDRVDRETAFELEKIVACLPDVESLEDGEVRGLGAILSEIMDDENRPN
jgi:hypothetical protein